MPLEPGPDFGERMCLGSGQQFVSGIRALEDGRLRPGIKTAEEVGNGEVREIFGITNSECGFEEKLCGEDRIEDGGIHDLVPVGMENQFCRREAIHALLEQIQWRWNGLA